MAYDPLPQAESGVLDELSVWQELEEKELLGPSTRRWLQHFCFSCWGWLWAVCTLAVCGYSMLRPNEGLAALMGQKATCLAAAMSGIATMCTMISTSGALSLLTSEVFRKLLNRHKQAAFAFQKNDQFECELVPMLYLARKLLVFALLMGIPLSRAFSDALYFLAWLLLIGLMMFYYPGAIIIRRVVGDLSRSLVEDLMKDIRDGIEVYKGSGQFWQAMTEKHKQMDRMLEQTWALAKWMIVPHMIAMLMIAIIGLVACLSAVVTSQNGLTACCGLCSICLMVVLMSSRLWELASITQMCMSTTTETSSILSHAIAKSGTSPCSQTSLKTAGYSSFAEERADHSRFLTYLMVNRTGVEMFGVLIDSQLITRFLAQATTGFVALLSYMLANLDIRKEDLVAHLDETGRYFSKMIHLQ
ncbi:unnamed protein product [Durusdinium trenchii]|uniref:ABC transmembrane type-1 domain-containing protein n=1 Tax=Durusdinium trenchii TaxID=1381693 RepID=A0ABP0M1C8_9DINO